MQGGIVSISPFIRYFLQKFRKVAIDSIVFFYHSSYFDFYIFAKLGFDAIEVVSVPKVDCI